MAAVSERVYRVAVTREDGHWLADVPDLQGAHTYARSLPGLDQAVREVIVLAADLPDEAMPKLVIDYDYHTSRYPPCGEGAICPRCRRVAGHQFSAGLATHRQGQLARSFRELLPFGVSLVADLGFRRSAQR